MGKKKRIIQDRVELEKIIDYYLRNDLSLVLLEETYDLTYPQRDFLLKKSMGYSRQQDILMEEYNTTDVAATYLEIPHDIKEEDTLETEEQIRLFKRLDEIDKEHIIKKLNTANDELSKVLNELKRIIDKHSNDVRLFNQYRRQYPDRELKDILLENGIKPLKAENLCVMYLNYRELMKRKNKLTKERDNLLRKRRELLDTNYEYARITETLTTTNVKLANWVIREFFRNVPLPKDEAQALALEGLSKAINRFDYTLGYTFSTYATKVMVHHIKHHFKDIMGISWVNYCMRGNIAYWREELANYDEKRTQMVTPQDLADSGLVKYTVTQIENMDEMVDIIYNFSDYYEEPDDSEVTTTDEMPITQEDYDYVDAIEDMMGMSITDEQAEQDEWNLYFPFMQRDLYEVLGEMCEREQKIIIARFGLEDGIFRTLEEVGKLFFISHDRVRQIEAKTLRKMRHPSRRARLYPYIEHVMMPKHNREKPTTEECVEAFMRLYDFRSSNLPYSAKAFFISKRNMEIDGEEARVLDILMDVFIMNISLGYQYNFTIRDIMDKFADMYGAKYEYKYPYDSIYKALENRLEDEEKKEFSEEEKKLLKREPENLINMAVNNNC